MDEPNAFARINIMFTVTDMMLKLDEYFVLVMVCVALICTIIIALPEKRRRQQRHQTTTQGCPRCDLPSAQTRSPSPFEHLPRQHRAYADAALLFVTVLHETFASLMPAAPITLPQSITDAIARQTEHIRVTAGILHQQHHQQHQLLIGQRQQLALTRAISRRMDRDDDDTSVATSVLSGFGEEDERGGSDDLIDGAGTTRAARIDTNLNRMDALTRSCVENGMRLLRRTGPAAAGPAAAAPTGPAAAAPTGPVGAAGADPIDTAVG